MRRVVLAIAFSAASLVTARRAAAEPAIGLTGQALASGDRSAPGFAADLQLGERVGLPSNSVITRLLAGTLIIQPELVTGVRHLTARSSASIPNAPDAWAEHVGGELRLGVSGIPETFGFVHLSPAFGDLGTGVLWGVGAAIEWRGPTCDTSESRCKFLSYGLVASYEHLGSRTDSEGWVTFGFRVAWRPTE